MGKMTGTTADIEKVLITKEEIEAKVAQMGSRISADYKDKNLMVISVLKGSFVFVSDLIRKIDIPLSVDFMAVSSYGSEMKSSGVVKIAKDLDIPLENVDLLIVEDILDSGKTLQYITNMLKGRNPKSIKIATLLDKPSRREAQVVADYVGFAIPDEFVVGYGLDYCELYRNLDFIGIMKRSVYETE